MFATTRGAAQAGPPYLTDDPDPVPRGHWEAYIFSLSDGTHAGTALTAPSYEMNYGAAKNLQLHFVLPYVHVFAPGTPTAHGLGDIEVGAKYKLIDESELVPEIGVFPFVELATGDPGRGLGFGTTWYRLPVWLKKGFGNWSVYGGGGAVVVPQDGFVNQPFTSVLVQNKLGSKWVLGMEMYGHGAQNSGPDGLQHAVLVNLGGYYSFNDHMQFMFAGGHSVAWQAETYTYAAMYWTWGKGPDDQKESVGSKEPLLRIQEEVRWR